MPLSGPGMRLEKAVGNKKAAVVAQGGLTSNQGAVRVLAAPPIVEPRETGQGLRIIPRVHGVIAAKRTPAGDGAGKSPLLRLALCLTKDRHDSRKVNFDLESVNSFFGGLQKTPTPRGATLALVSSAALARYLFRNSASTAEGLAPSDALPS